MPFLATGPRVLIVDDEAAIADSLELIFASRGYTVRTASNAEAAIALLTEFRPDVAIVDVMLPRMSGIDLARVVEERSLGCFVILVSGHPSAEELLTQAERQGHSFDVLAKPLHPALLLDRVASLLEAVPVRMDS